MLFQSFWYGRELTPIERLTITSFLEHEHEFVLYVYDDVANVPKGCRVEEAEGILPREAVFLHEAGVHVESVGAFSDVFRYHLLRARGGWWVDTDVICLRRDIPETVYVFAEQEPGLINGAILRVPPGSALAAAACARTVGADAETAFSTIGPRLLTDLVHELGLEGHAWSSSALYPLGWRDALDTLDPDRRASVERRGKESCFLHLWGEMLRLHNVLTTVRPPAGSFLDAMFELYAIPFPAAPRYEFAQLRPQIWLHEHHWAMKEELTRLYEQLSGR